MLVLRANRELENTYKTLIQTTGVKVDWNGLFVVIDNNLILEGSPRSLFFQFDTRKVVTNIIELDYNADQIVEITQYPKIKNLINIILYAFGKWGTLKGLRVDKDYTQLNDVFAQVMREFQVEPSYRIENFRFLQKGIQITYEELIQIAIEAADKPIEEETQNEEEEEAQGLWHKLTWRNQKRAFRKVPTMLEERQKERIGHNFYQVGYQCPMCTEKLHMVVYPPGKEQRIETQELGVYIARAYTCNGCNCFFTPRPQRLISEGDIYEMPFGSDKKAYEDYLELLGQAGERTANFKYNEYEAVRNRKPSPEELAANEYFESLEEAENQMEAYSNRLDTLPDETFNRFTDRMEDGFYPGTAVRRNEKKILEQVVKRHKEKQEAEKKKRASKDKDEVEEKEKAKSLKENRTGIKKETQTHPRAETNGYGSLSGEQVSAVGRIPSSDIAGSGYPNEIPERESNNKTINTSKMQPQEKTEADTSYERYQARLGVLDRLSERQRADLKKQILNDKSLDENTKKELLRPVEEARIREKTAELERKVDSCGNRTYAQIQKVADEVEKEELPHGVKRPLLERLGFFIRKRAQEEVGKIMEKLPERMDFAGFRSLEQKLQKYPEADLTPYRETLAEKREVAEKQEIANMVKRARKINRDDYVDLMLRLEEQEFKEDNVTPYMEKLQDKIREMDEKRLDEICENTQQMDFDTALDAYEKIDQGDFLPELKMNALEMLSRRLAKIKTDECELLVRKFKDDTGGKIKENPSHYFYPARKVLLKTAEPEETAVIDYALATYAGGRGLFEYPIFAVDTSRNGSGKEGMILTPEHLFYSTMLKAYEVPISVIKSIDASTGLLNRKITLEEKDGTKHKLPYAVGTGEMKTWAGLLENFIRYLQEKPASRKVTYLAKETHDTICCFRCGYVYHGSQTCPKCGYKKNH